MSQHLQPSIILLREGTDTSQGKAQLIANINACEAVADVVRTTLGPRGMDKMIVHDASSATISNDGAEILKLLDIVHPAAKVLVDIAKAQDAEVGDGTTSVTLIACELLKHSKKFIEDGVHPQIIMRGYRRATKLALELLEKRKIVFSGDDMNPLLEKVAGTALNSKLIARNKNFFAPMCVKAVRFLEPPIYNLELVGIKKVTGGSVTDSVLVQGVAFKKTFSYAGFEQQPKSFKNPKILLLNVELELKSEKDNAEVRIEDPEQYQSIVDAEWAIIYRKLEACVKSGAKIILSRLPIGDLATQYFADRGLFCAGRLKPEDVDRVEKATGAKIQTGSLDEDLTPYLGECGSFEERQVGSERFNFFTECPKAKTCTIILRGGSEQFVAEAARSLHDALMVVKKTLQSGDGAIVGGAGSIEMEIASFLREKALEIKGKEQLIVSAFADALEVIPRQLAENAGLEAVDIISELRKRHQREFVENAANANDSCGSTWAGVNVLGADGGCVDAVKGNIWEPASNKRNSLAAASEAACLVLSIDQTVRNPKSEQAQIEAHRNMTSHQDA